MIFPLSPSCNKLLNNANQFSSKKTRKSRTWNINWINRTHSNVVAFAAIFDLTSLKSWIKSKIITSQKSGWSIVADWLMDDWFYVCHILDNVLVLDCFLLTALTFQSQPSPFFHAIYSTIGDFKISTSLISNRYRRCAITPDDGKSGCTATTAWDW
jgi:hypothetical protein